MEFANRPPGITALSIFFSAGAFLSFVSGISLVLPGSFLEPMWRLNPKAYHGLVSIGAFGIVLMFVVSIACAFTAIGLWRGFPWGRWLAIGMIGINLIANTANAIAGTEPRTIVGVPIAGAILFYLLSSKRARQFFQRSHLVN